MINMSRSPHPLQYAPLLLASGSPRRRELLDMAGFQYRAASSDIDEEYPASLNAYEVAPFLAGRKMEASLSLATREEIVLTADSVVIRQEKVYGKPADRGAAIQMISELQGGPHEVKTAICLARDRRIWSGSAVTKVFLEPMDLSEITYYVDHWIPYDKAGAYGIQDWIGLCKIGRIEGSYPNVVGLPIHLLCQALKDKVV